MARKLRVQYKGAIYHIMSRGDRRRDIFLSNKDRELFLETLDRACEKTGWEVHAFSLLPKEFHLVIQTPQPNLVTGMKWLVSTYTGQFNRINNLSGHLFSGRYKALFLDDKQDVYLKTACDYVHLKPARAGLVGPKQKLSAYRWSSYGEYLKAPKERWPRLMADRLLGAYKTSDNAAGRRAFEKLMESRRAAGDEEFRGVERGWCLGSKKFKQELLERMSQQTGVGQSGLETPEVEERKAGRIVTEELKALGWTTATLNKLPKGDPEKLRIAARVRRETTVTFEWIAERMRMGAKTSLSSLLYWVERRAKTKPRKARR